jgi:hypothetical protein
MDGPVAPFRQVKDVNQVRSGTSSKDATAAAMERLGTLEPVETETLEI